jgi:hypothetical protein
MRRQFPATAITPTAAPPGSPEKVAVLMQRARLRQSLWHPQDATLTRGRGCPSEEASPGPAQPRPGHRISA